MKSLNNWINHIALRWFTKGTDTSTSFIPAAAGIAIGVTALIVIISVMNGFQMGFIESVLELDSYHLRIARQATVTIDQISSLPQIRTVMAFSETRTMIRNQAGSLLPVKLKFIPDNPEHLDPELGSRLNLIQGSLQNTDGILIGNEMARRLRVATGDTLSLLVLKSSVADGLNTELAELEVKGIYNSAYYEFDSGLAFLSESAIPDLLPEGLEFWGIMLKDRFDDILVMSQLIDLGIPLEDIESWRTYNKAFFGALRMEKTIMLLLVGIIFLVVGVNIFYAMRKIIFERMDEIAILKAIGGRVYSVRHIFVINGLVTGTGGALIGLIFGLLISMHINSIAKAIETAAGLLAGFTGLRQLNILSSDIFYMAGIPVRIVFSEVLFITLAGIFSAVFAAWFSSGRITKFGPAEVLRHE